MNAWFLVEPCGASAILPPFFMEALTVTAPNILSPLTRAPDGAFIMLVVNGAAFLPVGAHPPFSVSGQAITWLSTVYGINVGDDVSAAYSYLGLA